MHPTSCDLLPGEALIKGQGKLKGKEQVKQREKKDSAGEEVSSSLHTEGKASRKSCVNVTMCYKCHVVLQCIMKWPSKDSGDKCAETPPDKTTYILCQ